MSMSEWQIETTMKPTLTRFRLPFHALQSCQINFTWASIVNTGIDVGRLTQLNRAATLLYYSLHDLWWFQISLDKKGAPHKKSIRLATESTEQRELETKKYKDYPKRIIL